MDKFSTAELVSFFKRFCPDVECETLEIIQNEKISGKRAIKLDLQGWKSVGISYGEAVDIVGAIESFQSGCIQYDCSAVHENVCSEVNEGKNSSSDNSRFSTLDESDPEVQQGYQSSFSNSLLKVNCSSNRFPSTSPKIKSHFTAPCGDSDALCSKSASQPTTSSNNAAGSSPAATPVLKVVHPQIVSKTKFYQCGQQTLELNDLSDVDSSNVFEGGVQLDDSDSEASTDFSSIEKYFKPADFKEMSVYEKEAYLRQKKNYERGLLMPGLSALKMPGFMQISVKKSGNTRKTAAKVNQKNQSSGSNSQLDANNPPSSSKFSRTLRSHLTASSENSNASCSKSASQPTASSDNANGSSPGTSSVVKVVGSKNANKTKSNQHSHQALEFNDFSDVVSSHESETPSGSEPPKKKRKRRKNNRSENMSEDAFSAKLPKFDIDNILSNAGQKLKKVRDTLHASGIVYGKDRKLLIRTLTKHLYFKHVDNIKLVTTEMKSGMAASLVSLYPSFKDETDPHKRSWWRIFNPDGPSGFLANASIGILRSLDSKDRPRGGGQGTSYLPEEDGTSDKENNSSDVVEHPDVEWMRTTMPWASNKAKLAQGMEASFEHRRRWILSKGPSVTEILNIYPHLMSFNCEFLEKEFSLVCPDKGHLFSKMFPHLIKSLKECNELHTVEELNVGENCDTLGACLSIAKQLPRPNLQKNSRMTSAKSQESVMPHLQNLVTIVPLGTNVQDVVDKRRKEAKAPVQPYLLALVPDKDVTKLFLVADSQILQMPSGSILPGLAMLFKSYTVFNVMYPLGWLPFWELVENGLFQMQPRKLTNSAVELLKKHKIIK